MMSGVPLGTFQNMSLLLLVVQCALCMAAPGAWLVEAARALRRRRTQPAQVGPCGIGGVGRILSPSYTYVSAPVVNYIFGCGSRPLLPDHQGLFSLARPQADHESQGGPAAQGAQGGQGGADAGDAIAKPLALQSFVTAAATRLGQYLVDYLTMPRPTEGRSLLKTSKSWISD